MNAVNMVGYVARDPELYGDNDRPSVGRFSMSVSNREWSKDDNAMTNVDRWFDFVGFTGVASAIKAVVRPGRKIAIVGYLTNDEYTTQEGETRRSLKIVVEKLSVVDWGEDNGGPAQDATPEPEDDEFPF